MYRKAKRNSSGDQESSLETLASSSPPLWHVLTQTPSRRASACASPWVRHRECVTACASPWVRHFASPPPPPTAGSPSAFSPRPQLQSLRRRLQGASRRCLPLSWELAPSVWPLRASHWRHVPTSWCMLPSALPVSGPKWKSGGSYGLARDGKDALEVGRRQVSRAAIVTRLLGSESHLCDAPPFESNWFVALSLEDLRLAQGSMHVYSAVGGILGFSNVSESPVYTWRQIFKRTTSYTSFTNPIRLGILVPWPGTKSVPPAVEAWSPSHWTAGEFQ